MNEIILLVVCWHLYLMVSLRKDHVADWAIVVSSGVLFLSVLALISQLYARWFS